MTLLHQLPTTPNAEEMSRVMRRLFERADEGLIEIGWTSQTHPHALNRARLFDLSEIDEAVDFAVELNSVQNRNVYTSAGLRRLDANRNVRGNASDVIAVVAFKIDCDKEGEMTAALDVSKRLGLPPNLATYTGHHPHTRGQLWWILETPLTDTRLSERIDRALMQRCGGDPKVPNPDRLMRLCGSVAWPLKDGRRLEMTGIYDVPTRDENYTVDEIVERLEAAGALEKQVSDGAVLLDFNQAEPQLDFESLIERAAAPGEWHKSALLATAHLLGRGTPPSVVVDLLTPMLTMPGYTTHQTRDEIAVMVEGAMRRGYGEAEEPRHDSEAPKAEGSPFLSIEQLLEMPPPEWLVDQYLVENGVSTLFGPPASFKTFIALDLALSVAYGVDWRGFKVKEARPVLYICAEGQHGLGARCHVWREHRAAGAECAGFWVLPVPVNFMDPAKVDLLIGAIEKFGVGARMIVIDTVARNFGQGDENNTKDMNAFISGVDRIRVKFQAHVMLVHHSGKDETKDERGSSVLRAAVDAAIRLSRDGTSETVVVKVKKQKDGPEAPDLTLTVPIAEAVHPKTGEVVTSRIPTLSDAQQAAQAARKPPRIGKNEREILEALRDGPQTFATLERRLGVTDRRNFGRALNSLEAKNIIENRDGLYALGVVSFLDASGE